MNRFYQADKLKKDPAEEQFKANLSQTKIEDFFSKGTGKDVKDVSEENWEREVPFSWEDWEGDVPVEGLTSIDDYNVDTVDEMALNNYVLNNLDNLTESEIQAFFERAQPA